jgi:hypothetical protein
LQKHNQQNLKHAKAINNDEFFFQFKRLKKPENNGVNDITNQKYVDMLQSLPKNLLCKYEGKMENPCAYSTYT